MDGLTRVIARDVKENEKTVFKKEDGEFAYTAVMVVVSKGMNGEWWLAVGFHYMTDFIWSSLEQLRGPSLYNSHPPSLLNFSALAIMSSSSSHAIVTYTFVSTDNDLLPWGFHLMEADEPEAPDDTEGLTHHQLYPAPLHIPRTRSKDGGGNFEEDPKMDHVDYAADEEEEESSNDDDDEEEHLASANSALPVPDFLRPASVSTYHLLLPSEIPSPPLTLPSPDHKDAILEADMPPRKRTCFIAPSYRFEIGESSVATVARQTGSTLARGVDYGFIDTLDANIRATGERVMTALEEVNDRMINLAATHRYESEEFYTRHQDAQDDRALLQACISTLEREAMEAQIRALHAKVRVMQRQRIDDGDRLTSHIQHEHDRFR
ncbi:hypothetical protein Tco_0562262 [Tanacetum coccineum]